VPYGWARTYKPGTAGLQLYQSLDAQLPDGLRPGAVPEPGQAPQPGQLVPDSPAAIVAEVFARYAAGWYDAKIAADLNARGIPVARPAGATASQRPQWRASRVRAVLVNPAYAGYRVYRGEILAGVDGQWTPLVTRDLFWACANRRAAKRGKYRDGAARRGAQYPAGGGPYLLAATARCGKCGGKLARWSDHGKSNVTHGHYTCTAVGCWGVSIRQPDLDAYAERRMVRWLSDETVAARLRAAREAEAEGETAAARAEAEQCERELHQLEADVEAGIVTARMASADQRRLERQIRAASARAGSSGVPAVLAGLLGADAARAWAALAVLERRAVIRAVAEIHVLPAGRGQCNQFTAAPVAGRVHWRWLIGPAAGAPYALPDPAPPRNRARVTVTAGGEVIVSGEYTTAGKGELAAALMAEHGWNVPACARAFGVERSSVRYWLRKAAAARDAA
jgi:hypothetical protein